MVIQSSTEGRERLERTQEEILNTVCVSRSSSDCTKLICKRHDVTDEFCALPSQHVCGLVTRIKCHYLVDQHRKVVIFESNVTRKSEC